MQPEIFHVDIRDEIEDVLGNRRVACSYVISSEQPCYLSRLGETEVAISRKRHAEVNGYVIGATSKGTFGVSTRIILLPFMSTT